MSEAKRWWITILMVRIFNFSPQLALQPSAYRTGLTFLLKTLFTLLGEILSTSSPHLSNIHVCRSLRLWWMPAFVGLLLCTWKLGSPGLYQKNGKHWSREIKFLMKIINDPIMWCCVHVFQLSIKRTIYNLVEHSEFLHSFTLPAPHLF